MHGRAVIIKRSESVLAQGSECRLLLGALGEAEQSAKRKAQRCFVPKGVYTRQSRDEIQHFVLMVSKAVALMIYRAMHGWYTMLAHWFYTHLRCDSLRAGEMEDFYRLNSAKKSFFGKKKIVLCIVAYAHMWYYELVNFIFKKKICTVTCKNIE